MPRTRRKKNQPLWTPQELRKEEVRGIFTIGVLSFLLGIKFAYGESTFIEIFGRVITLSNVIYPLLVFWGFYVLLMCLALSEDFITTPKLQFLPEFSKNLAQGMFYLGILALLAVTLLLFWLLVIIFLALWSFRYLHHRLKGRGRRSKKQKS